MTIIDDHIRQLVAIDGLHRTLFVEAGAGTGKTTQLVDRVKNLVLHKRIRLENIAAITFTEAAASELQDRIRVAFEKHAAEATDDAERTLCHQAIADADLAAISTLHGFAKRILGEHPLAAGLPPRVGILDEVSSELAREARWERFVDRLYSDPEHEPLLVRAALCDVPLEPRYQGHATLKDVAVELGQSWDRLDLIATMMHGPLPAVDFRPFDDAARAVEALSDQCDDKTDLLFCHLIEKVLPTMRAVAEIPDPDRKLRALVKAPKWTVGNVGKGAAWGSDVKAARATVTALNEARTAVIRETSEGVLSRLLTLVSAEVRDAAEARRSEGQLEFHDLLVLCRRLLRDNEEARAALHDRYTHLLLDEFQDTDPIQIELAVLIASAIEVGQSANWDQAKVDDGRLFFVGDPKQSIYRFRRADIELFMNARDVFGKGDNWVKLVTNFRSVPDVLAWINGLFDRLMSEEVPGKQPRYEPLVAKRLGSPAGDHRPVLLGGSHPKAKAGELREFEADDVADTIADIRSRPDAWPIFDSDLQLWRPARLTDITILLPTRTSLPYLRSALATRDIPYRINTGTLVYDTQEVRDALAALRAIDDPTDGLSLVSALRSPLYACSDVDLFTFKTAGGRWDFRIPPPDGIDPSHPVCEAFGHLRGIWEQRWWSSPSTLLDRLLEERQAFLLAFDDPRPREVWGRLRFLIDQARSFEEAGGGNLRAFLEWAELQRSESSRVHEPILPETDDHAIRIMTIHGSKGLEFPITIVSGMTTKPGGRRNGVSLVWEDGQPEVKLRANVSTANHDPRADIEMEMDTFEKLRLLYVACTRARDHLVIACHHKEGDGSYACIVAGLTASADGTSRTLELEDAPVETPALPVAQPEGVPPTDDRQTWADARETLLAPQRVSRVVSATAIAAAAARHADSDAIDGEPDPDPGQASAVPVRHRGRAGSAIGRAVHATLQVLDLANPVGLVEQATRNAYLEGMSGAAETVVAMVKSALASDAVQMAARNAHYKELYLAAPLEGRVIEGYIDLLIETPVGLVIVDYKTDSVSSLADVDRKLELYEVQGAAYAVALEATTGLEVTDCRFVFCRPSGAIERGVKDLSAAKHRVRVELRRQSA